MNDRSSKDDAAPRSTVAVDYDKLVSDFEDSLVNKLRGNRPDQAYLELWVPDSDPLKGIAQMVDAAFESGLQAISIRVSLATLGTCPVSKLAAEIGRIGRVSVEERRDVILLHVNDLQEFRTEARTRSSAAALRGGEASEAYVPSGRLGAPPPGPAEAYLAEALARVQVTQVEGRKEIAIDLATAPAPEAIARLEAQACEYGEIERCGDTLTVRLDPALAPFAAVAPTFRGALAAAFRDLTHEGTLTAVDGTIQLSHSADHATLDIAVDPAEHCIAAARHTGGNTPLRRAILDVFCRTIEGLPMVEAREHSGPRLLHALRDRRLHRPVAGIMRVVNAGPDLDLPAAMMREMYAKYVKATGYAPGINFYESKPSEAWIALTREAKIGHVQDILQEFCATVGAGHDDMSLRDLGKNLSGFEVRVFIGFSPSIDWKTKPALMMGFERLLKDRLEPRLEVYNEEARDKSPLRRL